MPTGLFYLNFLDQSISNIRGVWLVYIITMSIEFSVFNTNRISSVHTTLKNVDSALIQLLESTLNGHCFNVVFAGKCMKSPKKG